MKIYKSSEIKDIDKKIESESYSPLILDESKKSNSNSKKKKKKSTSQKKIKINIK